MWHRDWRDNVRGLRLAEWDRVMLDMTLFNQINCALYDDPCTWVVPGSHLRRDTPAEAQRFPTRPVPGPDLTGLSPAEAERALGLVDFTLYPHLDNPDMEDTTLANIGKWASGIPAPTYAIDDATAIKVVDGVPEVVSEGNWQLFDPQSR